MNDDLNLNCDLSKMSPKVKEEHLRCEELYRRAEARDKGLTEDQKIGPEEERINKLLLSGDLNFNSFKPNEDSLDDLIESIKDDDSLQDVDIRDFLKKHPSSILYFRLLEQRKTDLMFSIGIIPNNNETDARYQHKDLFLKREREKFLKLKEL